MAKYRNSFHNPLDASYGPSSFETDAKPVEHHGFLIYRRLTQCFDIVKDDICIGQYAGLNGAKDAIETRFRPLYPQL